MTTTTLLLPLPLLRMEGQQLLASPADPCGLQCWRAVQRRALWLALTPIDEARHHTQPPLWWVLSGFC
jgi:hypothetical protein